MYLYFHKVQQVIT